MFSSSAIAEAMTGASRRARTVAGFAGHGPAATGFAGHGPAAGRGQSERYRSVWESPRRGPVKAAHHKRARTGGRTVQGRGSSGQGTDRSGRPCNIAAASLMQSTRAG